MKSEPAPRTSQINIRSYDVDAAGLAVGLRKATKGEVRFDAGTRAMYSTDASNYRQVPIGVVIPRDTDDVIETVRVARSFGAPVLARGGGTSLAGQCCNVAVVIDMTKYVNGIISLERNKRVARVQPGVILDNLRNAAEKHSLTFGPDPATHNHCSLGGMIGNNSCGVHSLMAGKTDDNIEELEILTYDGLRMRVGQTNDDQLNRIIGEGGRRGEIYAGLKSLRDRYSDAIRSRYPKIPRRVSGYNLPQLLPENGFHVARALVGSECTCVTVLEATVKLVQSPPARKLVVLGYPDVFRAADHIDEILEHEPVGLEGMDDYLIEQITRMGKYNGQLALLPEGGGWLLVEFGGETEIEVEERAGAFEASLKKASDAPAIKVIDGAEEARMIWKIRESGLGATARVPGERDTWEGWEDSAVPPSKLGDYLRGLRRLLDKYDYACSLYGHFGQGCVHTRIDFDLLTQAGIDKFRSFLYEAADLVLSFDGSFSGEHGDGQARAELLPKMFGEQLIEAFREFKSIWDPEWKMNPGKIVDAYRVDENLRLGVHYNPPRLDTYFKYPDDDGSLARATLRCVGVGECRKEHAGTMCPSYMVTHEEMHSTRGRARLLFEMLEEDPLTGAWQSEHVKEALDLCLACKGCKGECPVRVDMATYKAEFLSHYYEEHWRPLHAYAFGFIHRWARMASIAPGLVNLITQMPGLSAVAKAIAGMASERQVPRFAPQTFKDWFRQRSVKNHAPRRVILWPDTFNNFFKTGTAVAAVEVLEAAGCDVIVPMRDLCCGRPLYDYGFLDTARIWLQQIIDELRPEIEAGTPIIGLEPSCISVFRDELTNLFPHDHDAARLSGQSYTLGEYLTKIDYRPPTWPHKALLHGHCHHQAVMGLDGEKQLIQKMGLDCELLDSGCCGMAGAFGFESGEHYEVSIKCGERVLLPAVRQAPKATLIIADGFSCREQISQATDRQALHLADVIRMAMQEGSNAIPGDYPERAHLRPRSDGQPSWRRAAMIGAGALACGALIIWARSHR